MAPPRNLTIEVNSLAGSGGDMATVDALARLVVEARRLGLELRLARAPSELRELIVFAGLGPALGLQVGGQPEQWEEALGVEEEGHLRDLPG
jgi:hypothetical protein